MNGAHSWDLYRSFAAVLRTGSLSAAARALDLTQPSVSRHIEALEQSVGGALFVRSQRGLSPTDRALAMKPYAEQLVAASAALLRSASADAGAVAGSVRITASEMVGVMHLPPLLAALRRAHPELSSELVVSNTVDDLLQRHADIAIRMVEPTQQALIAKRVGGVTLGLHAHRDYLERRGVPASADDLAGHDVIGPETMVPAVRFVMQALPVLTQIPFAMRSDSDLVHFAAIRGGVGIGICQVELAQRDPALVRVLPDAFAFVLPIWIVMHEDLRAIARCRVVFDALAAGLASIQVAK
ncbi:LysR family transcriptional regulator [Sphingomonas sp. S2-65]|uniref:LysR family transcriptional regulator n=1 Tax=Sphingomonas sp. S2-65 TaxID=2903960 RepID=UPI001F1E7CA7|nr:LysR family transcriptional regulator [Sphingomonas sp. S2-65]UYY57539.1 LysR family transcriptional regulator [Sphingomonas sp. S2-65]